MFVPYTNSIKALFINPTDAHKYKITGMLKQLNSHNCSYMFHFTPEPSSGSTINKIHWFLNSRSLTPIRSSIWPIYHVIYNTSL